MKRLVPWFKLWEHIGWPLMGAWVAYRGGWWAVIVVVSFAIAGFVTDRLVYWQRRLIEALQDDGPIPHGMIRVTRPGKAPVCVPLNADEAVTLSRLIDVVEGEAS